MKFSPSPDLLSGSEANHALTGNFQVLDNNWKAVLQSHDRFSPLHHQEIASLTLEAEGSTGTLRLGSRRQFSFGFGGSLQHQSKLEVIYADEVLAEDLVGILEGPPAPGRIILVLRTVSGVEVGAAAAGPIAQGVQLAASARSDATVEYVRTQGFDQDSEVVETLRTFLAQLRWPLKALTQAPAWEPQDTATVRFNGGFAGEVAVQAGYRFEGSPSLQLGGLKPTFHYEVGIAGRVTGSLQTRGRYALTTLPGTRAGWTRVKVQRDRSSERDLGVEFSAGLAWETADFFSSSRDLAQTLFGLDTGSVLSWLETLAEGEAGSLDAVKQRLRERGETLAADLIGDLSEDLFAWTAQNLPLAEVQGLAGDLAAQLRGLQTLDASLLHRLERWSADQRAVAASAIEAVLQATTPQGLADWLAGQAAAQDLEWLHDLVGDRLVALATDQDLFARFRSALETAHTLLTEPEEALSKYFERYRRFLDERLSISLVIEKLDTVSDPSALHGLLEGKLGALAHKLLEGTLDTAAAQFNSTDVDKVQRAAKAFLRFVDSLDERLQELAKGQAQLSLELAFSHSRAGSAILDVEFDLGTDEGVRDYAALMAGNLGSLLRRAAPHYFFHEGLWQEESKRTRRLAIQVAGWQFSRVLERTLNHSLSQISVDAHTAAINFATQGELAEETRRGGENTLETFRANFLLRVAADSVQTTGAGAAAAASTTASLAAGYTFAISDEEPRWDELPDYLNLALQLGILRDRADFAAKLRAEAQDRPLQALAIDYQVVLDPAALLSMFDRLESIEDIVTAARETVRGYFKDKFHVFDSGTRNGVDFATYARIQGIVRWFARQAGPHRPGSRMESVQVLLDDGSRPIFRKGPGQVFTIYQLLKAERAFVEGMDELRKAVAHLRELPPGTVPTAAHYHDATKAIGAILDLRAAKGALSRYWRDHLLFLALYALCENFSTDPSRNLAVMRLQLTLGDGAVVHRVVSA